MLKVCTIHAYLGLAATHNFYDLGLVTRTTIVFIPNTIHIAAAECAIVVIFCCVNIHRWRHRHMEEGRMFLLFYLFTEAKRLK